MGEQVSKTIKDKGHPEHRQRDSRIPLFFPSDPYGYYLTLAEKIAAPQEIASQLAEYLLQPAPEQRVPLSLLARQLGTGSNIVVMLGVDIQNDITNPLQERLRVIAVNASSKLEPTDQIAKITIDGQNGTRDALDRLISLGHSSVAYLSGSADNPDALDRERLFKALAEEAGIRNNQIEFPTANSSDFARGHMMATATRRSTNKPTALICYSDSIAIGAMRSIYDQNGAVPDDVSLVGFGDTELGGFNPIPLASVGFQLGDVVSAVLQATSGFSETGKNPFPDGEVIIPTRFIQRQSVGPAKLV